MAGRYTPNSSEAKRPVYLAVNVYRAHDGWYLVTRVMRSGGRAPRTIRLVDRRVLASEPQSLQQAARLASQALLELAEQDGI